MKEVVDVSGYLIYHEFAVHVFFYFHVFVFSCIRYDVKLF